MSKLYAREKVVTTSQIENDGYHCCRWCHWCENRGIDGFVCIKGSVRPVEANQLVHDLIEEGKLSEVVEEALHDCPEGVKEFKQNMTTTLFSVRSNVSRKAVEKFQGEIDISLDQFLDMKLKERLLESLETMISNYQCMAEGASSEVVIKDPHTHYCRDFW